MKFSLISCKNIAKKSSTRLALIFHTKSKNGSNVNSVNFVLSLKTISILTKSSQSDILLAAAELQRAKTETRPFLESAKTENESVMNTLLQRQEGQSLCICVILQLNNRISKLSKFPTFAYSLVFYYGIMIKSIRCSVS